MEYKCITKEEFEFQKLLNQWKHDYEIEIIAYNTNVFLDTIENKKVERIMVSALIKRTKKR